MTEKGRSEDVRPHPRREGMSDHGRVATEWPVAASGLGYRECVQRNVAASLSVVVPRAVG
jgi:hypothetical protein